MNDIFILLIGFIWGVITLIIVIRWAMKKWDMFIINKTEYKNLKKNQVKVLNND